MADRPRTSPVEDRPQFITKEISNNSEGVLLAKTREGLLAEKFEGVIERYRKRGYRLHSWNLSRMMTGRHSIDEQIIAVFEREDK